MGTEKCAYLLRMVGRGCAEAGGVTDSLTISSTG